MLSIFSCTCWPSICLLWKNVYSDPLPILKIVFVFLLLGCMRSLYILGISLLSDIWCTNIFSHSVCCLFIWLMVSFDVQMLFSLMSHLFILAFCALSKKSLPRPKSRSYFPKFSSRSFTASYISVLIHFKLIFVSSVR